MCDDECQALEELEVHKTSHLVEVGPEEEICCSPYKRQFKFADDLLDKIKWYQKDLRGVHGVMCALCRRYERIWQQRTDPKKQL